jgi:hypothetical protein
MVSIPPRISRRWCPLSIVGSANVLRTASGPKGADVVTRRIAIGPVESVSREHGVHELWKRGFQRVVVDPKLFESNLRVRARVRLRLRVRARRGVRGLGGLGLGRSGLGSGFSQFRFSGGSGTPGAYS